MQPARLLLVEPDPLQSVGMRGALGASGFPCAVAEDAAALPPGRYDLILLGPGHDEPAARRATAAVRASAPAAAIVVLTALPDLMIGHAAPGPAPPSELPAILEALTRYMRFAPARGPVGAADLERLVGDWAAFDGDGER